mgnify:CR=1 FL=1
MHGDAHLAVVCNCTVLDQRRTTKAGVGPPFARRDVESGRRCTQNNMSPKKKGSTSGVTTLPRMPHTRRQTHIVTVFNTVSCVSNPPCTTSTSAPAPGAAPLTLEAKNMWSMTCAYRASGRSASRSQTHRVVLWRPGKHTQPRVHTHSKVKCARTRSKSEDMGTWAHIVVPCTGQCIRGAHKVRYGYEAELHFTNIQWRVATYLRRWPSQRRWTPVRRQCTCTLQMQPWYKASGPGDTNTHHTDTQTRHASHMELGKCQNSCRAMSRG